MSSRKSSEETLEYVMDIREYDVPYYVRVAMDLGKLKFFKDVKCQNLII